MKNKCTRQQNHVTVVSLLIKKAAVNTDSMHNGQLLLMKKWQMSVHLLSVQFCNYVVLCHTQNFDSDVVVFAKH
jgi:hypothetical protein